MKTLSELYSIWDALAAVPVNDDGDCLSAPFQCFDSGASVVDVWHWFESQNPDFVVGDVMQGIRKATS